MLGAAAFAKLEASGGRSRAGHEPVIALTKDTGTIRVVGKATGEIELYRYDDAPDEPVDLSREQPLDWGSNPTDWKSLLRAAVEKL
jgi:hypothetical protein